jgi:formyl-CoA transferase
VKNRAEANRLMAEFCATRTKRDAEVALAGAGLTAGAVHSYMEAAQDPHVRARDMLQEVSQYDGKPAHVIGPAAKMSRTPLRVRSGAASLGQHNDEILAELGLSPDERAKLREMKIV